MKIKTPIKSILPIFIFLLLGVELFFSFLETSIILSIVISFLWLIFCVKEIYTQCKIIYMSEDGCVVKFLFWKQRYTWDELKTKLIVYNGVSASKEPFRAHQYTKTVVFSKKEKFKIPTFIDIETHYHICLKPWSYFIVNLKTKEQRASWPTYEIDEELFMSKMAEWGVEFVEAPIRY